MCILAGFMGLEEIDADAYLGSLGKGDASTAEAKQDSKKKLAQPKKRKEAPGGGKTAEGVEVAELDDESAGAADVAVQDGPSKKKQKQKAIAAAERQVLSGGGTTGPNSTAL